MNNIKEFDGTPNLRSLDNFWLVTVLMLAGVLVLTTAVVLRKRKSTAELRSERWKKLPGSKTGEKADSKDMA